MFQLSCYRPRLLRELFPLPLKGVVIIIKIAFGATVTFLFVCSLCILTFFFYLPLTLKILPTITCKILPLSLCFSPTGGERDLKTRTQESVSLALDVPAPRPHLSSRPKKNPDSDQINSRPSPIIDITL